MGFWVELVEPNSRLLPRIFLDISAIFDQILLSIPAMSGHMATLPRV